VVYLNQSLPTDSAEEPNVLTQLNSVIKTKLEQAQAGAEFEQVEKEMHSAFVEAERLVFLVPMLRVGMHTVGTCEAAYGFPRRTVGTGGVGGE